MRIYQQTFGSATPYANYKDVITTDQNSADVSIGGNVTSGARMSALSIKFLSTYADIINNAPWYGL